MQRADLATAIGDLGTDVFGQVHGANFVDITAIVTTGRRHCIWVPLLPRSEFFPCALKFACNQIVFALGSYV